MNATNYQTTMEILESLLSCAWEDYQRHLATYRELGISGALSAAHDAKAEYHTLDRAIAAILENVDADAN